MREAQLKFLHGAVLLSLSTAVPNDLENDSILSLEKEYKVAEAELTRGGKVYNTHNTHRRQYTAPLPQQSTLFST